MNPPSPKLAVRRRFFNQDEVFASYALIYRTQSPIACAYYENIRPHCHSEQHACRCVANRWLAIAWKLWQTGQVYDQAYHFQQRAMHSEPHR